MNIGNDYSGKRIILPIIGIYYLILLIIALSWTNQDLVEPSAILRYLYLFCFVLPLIKYTFLAPSLIALFYSIRLFSIAPFGYLPTQPKIYLYITAALFIFHSFNGWESSKTNRIFIVLLFLVVFSNLLNYVKESTEASYNFNFLRFLLISIFLSKLIRDSNDVKLIEWSFIISTFCLSIYGLVFYKDLVNSMVNSTDIQRVYWNDPNYLGSVIAIGMIISFYYLMDFNKFNIGTKIFLILTFIIGLLNLGMFASRGAFIALVVPVLYILYKRTNSIKIALFTLSLVAVLAFVFSTLTIFEPLIDRFSDASITTGSERTTIWENSLGLFSKLDLIRLFFGGGGNFSYELVGKAIGLATESPHNNYLEILYDYGIFGLVSFIILLIHWFRSNKKNILAVSLILILIVSCLTLSPLMYAPFWFLMILIENQNLN